ncbi:hypothetical protein [Klebsiella pneumoniae]|uniref:hypothetical protein n=1 Tax=Klebsiella pneumoniae TaxID=573 RepID=UPI002DBC090B|nr:hypothetical protein [Klebsiella pneumoniae]MEB5845925.1 hypothetical protein [Klebsiella pneumoniae]
MTKSTITRERAQQIFLGNGPEPSASEERELARMALAAMDGEAVAEVYQAPNVGICAALGPSIRMLCPLEPGTKLYRHAPPADEDETEKQWRSLALQFDGHRMQAISFLKQILKELPATEFSSAREFLKAGPLTGEEILRNRIAEIVALSQPAPVVPDDVSIFEAAIEECKTCDSIDEHAWNHGVLVVMAKYESCRAAILQTAPAHPFLDKGHKWSYGLIHPENCQCVECRSARLSGGKP